jgi:anti-anti-sigma factor
MRFLKPRGAKVEFSAKTWRSVLDSALTIILVVDREFIIQYINNTIPSMNKDLVTGKSEFDFIAPEHHELVRATHERVLQTGESEEYDTKGIGPDGQSAWYSSHATAVRSNGDIVGLAIFTQDVTARIETEKQLVAAKNELIEQQSRAIRELSTPAIQVWDKILILPLIGTLDTARAMQLIEQLLQTVATKQAEVVIIDITGVPVVDTSVAASLLDTIRAVRMLGAECVVTGVNPAIAQTLVRSGATFGDVETRGSLQGGLEFALQLTGRRVVIEGQ